MTSDETPHKISFQKGGLTVCDYDCSWSTDQKAEQIRWMVIAGLTGFILQIQGLIFADAALVGRLKEMGILK